MSQSPPTTPCTNKLNDIYKDVCDLYSLQDKNNRYIGLKNLNYEINYSSTSFPYLLEFNILCATFTSFFNEYRTHNMWFTDSEHERVTVEDKNSSLYFKSWFILDNFFEDAIRAYQRIFSVDSLFGLFEIFDACSTTNSLSLVHNSMYSNYKVCCLLNLGNNSLHNCFINHSNVELKPNCLYLFPSFFTHKLNFDESEECFVFLAGAA